MTTERREAARSGDGAGLGKGNRLSIGVQQAVRVDRNFNANVLLSAVMQQCWQQKIPSPNSISPQQALKNRGNAGNSK
jgi:hypothetical protein